MPVRWSIADPMHSTLNVPPADSVTLALIVIAPTLRLLLVSVPPVISTAGEINWPSTLNVPPVPTLTAPPVIVSTPADSMLTVPPGALSAMTSERACMAPRSDETTAVPKLTTMCSFPAGATAPGSQ